MWDRTHLPPPPYTLPHTRVLAIASLSPLFRWRRPLSLSTLILSANISSSLCSLYPLAFCLSVPTVYRAIAPVMPLPHAALLACLLLSSPFSISPALYMPLIAAGYLFSRHTILTTVAVFFSLRYSGRGRKNGRVNGGSMTWALGAGALLRAHVARCCCARVHAATHAAALRVCLFPVTMNPQFVGSGASAPLSLASLTYLFLWFNQSATILWVRSSFCLTVPCYRSWRMIQLQRIRVYAGMVRSQPAACRHITTAVYARYNTPHLPRLPTPAPHVAVYATTSHLFTSTLCLHCRIPPLSYLCLPTTPRYLTL